MTGARCLYDVRLHTRSHAVLLIIVARCLYDVRLHTRSHVVLLIIVARCLYDVRLHTVPRGTAVCRMRVNVSLAAYATCDRTASTLELQATLSAQSLVHWLSSREVSSTLTLDISSSVCHFTTNTAIIIHFFTFTTLAGLR